jgi:gas vesicle protein
MSKNRSGIFIGGLMLGAAIGTLAGLLVAPRTGRETRKLIKKSANAIPELAEDISTSVQIQADRLSITTLQNWDETIDRLREAIAVGIDATQRESQSLNKQTTVDVSSTTDNTDTLTEKLERS